jgi:F-type H+-transporting ATPase subunit epsilon
MENPLRLEVVTPDNLVVGESADYVGAPGVEGEFGVLPHHVNLLSALAVGVLRYTTGGGTRLVFISGGFADVSDNKVTVLAESAEYAEDIDRARAQAARERAEKRLASKEENLDMHRAEAALKRAVTRLSIVGGK